MTEMLIRSNLPKIQVPEGKRSVRETVYGNVNAYVAGRFWKTLGPVFSIGIEEKKAAWLNGDDDK